MSEKSFENLRTIRFEGELLPKWAQLLNLAAMLWEVPEPTRQWFSRFTDTSGVDDARTIIDHCALLRGVMQTRQEIVAGELKRRLDEDQPVQILAAWIYSVETIMLCANAKSTCSWIVDGTAQPEVKSRGSWVIIGADQPDDNGSGGDIGLRRI